MHVLYSVSDTDMLLHLASLAHTEEDSAPDAQPNPTHMALMDEVNV